MQAGTEQARSKKRKRRRRRNRREIETHLREEADSRLLPFSPKEDPFYVLREIEATVLITETRSTAARRITIIGPIMILAISVLTKVNLGLLDSDCSAILIHSIHSIRLELGLVTRCSLPKMACGRCHRRCLMTMGQFQGLSTLACLGIIHLRIQTVQLAHPASTIFVLGQSAFQLLLLSL